MHHARVLEADTPWAAPHDSRTRYKMREREREQSSVRNPRTSPAYRPIFVRRQCRRFALYRILFPVRMRIHCGIGRFCFSFFASVFFVRIVLLAGMAAATQAAET